MPLRDTALISIVIMMSFLSRAELQSIAPAEAETISRSTLGLGLLIVLAVGHFSAAVIRNLPSVVAADIQSTFGIGDATFGLLHGPAFAVVNVVAIVLAAAFIDRIDRFRVMGLCMAGWSLGSLAFAFAPTLESLFAARVTVGLSQAAFTPCAVSLIRTSGAASALSPAAHPSACRHRSSGRCESQTDRIRRA